MPTPRPETAVTFSAVESPGMKIRFRVSRSESRGGLFSGDDAAVDGFGANFGDVDALAVVDDFDVDLSALVIGAQVEEALAGFARSLAYLGCLDAVVNGVAQDVGHRVLDGFDDGAVQLGGLSVHDQFDFFAQVGG